MGRAHPIELTNMCMLTRADGKVLVQNRIDPNWGGLTFPGGHVEPGETPYEAAERLVFGKREIRPAFRSETQNVFSSSLYPLYAIHP